MARRAKGGSGPPVVNEEKVQELIEKGLISPADLVQGEAGPSRRPKAKEFVRQEVLEHVPGVRFAFALALHTVNESNQREWKGRSNRIRVARERISRFLGPHARLMLPFTEAYHRGDVVRLTFTRLAPADLDRMAGLPSSMKAVEDAVAMMMGANDGAKNWVATADQQRSKLWGVAIKIELAGPGPGG